MASEVIDLTCGHDASASNKKRRLASSERRGEWQPFYLVRSTFPSAQSDEGCLSMGDVIQEDTSGENPLLCALLFNYMIDLDWLLSEVPRLASLPTFLYHGSDQAGFTRAQSVFPNIHSTKVDVHVQFGTHHSKLGILLYRTGLRLFIGTNNLIEVDNTCKTQGVYVQDFPLLADATSSGGATNRGGLFDFQSDLGEYLREVCECCSAGAATTKLRSVVASLPSYDFSGAKGVLVGSVPGRHSGRSLHKWGHLRVRAALQAYALPAAFDSTCPILMQVSSLGSMGKDERFIDELAASFTVSARSDAQSLRRAAPVELVWPSSSCVRNSAQGVAAGESICCNAKTVFASEGVLKSGLRRVLRQWDGTPSGRALSTPHMKCYFRYRLRDDGRVELGWLLLTSSNASQAAWGVLQSNGSKLFIKSFELGVLFLPQKVNAIVRTFSCTPTHPVLGVSTEKPSKAEAPPETLAGSPSKFIISTSATSVGKEVAFPVPFLVPPPLYGPSDSPWVWD